MGGLIQPSNQFARCIFYPEERFLDKPVLQSKDKKDASLHIRSSIRYLLFSYLPALSPPPPFSLFLSISHLIPSHHPGQHLCDTLSPKPQHQIPLSMILGAGYIAYVWPLDSLRHTINLDKMQAGILCLVLISPEYLCVCLSQSLSLCLPISFLSLTSLCLPACLYVSLSFYLCLSVCLSLLSSSFII